MAGTLITYSADTADTLPGQSIQLEDLSARAEGGLKVIRVLDPAQRMFFIQISECKTWFVRLAPKPHVGSSLICNTGSDG